VDPAVGELAGGGGAVGEYQEASEHLWRGSARPGLAHGGLATSAPQLSRRRPEAGLLWQRRAMEEGRGSCGAARGR